MESYLNQIEIIKIAIKTGAGAIHPGYGFLSENASFARKVTKEGITWVGPSPNVISVMGDKLKAKDLAIKADVPTLPMTSKPNEAKKIGYPLLIKAAAGGGGKGMRIVHKAKELKESITSAQREAKKAILHRFVAASALGRYYAINQNKFESILSMDIAFPRNEKDWFEILPKEIDDSFEMKLYYGHLFCHVLHHNYVVKKGVDTEELTQKLLKTYEDKGAEYPAEHNVGHEYFAKPSLSSFYKKLDPTNAFNPGIGKTSKKKYWK